MNTFLKRTFIAFQVNSGREILNCIRHLKNSLKEEKIKWVDTERLHITVTFIGETQVGQIDAIGKILEEHVPLYTAPLLRIKGMGLFRNLSNPRVIWLGVDPIPAISELKLQVDKELEKTGLSIEKREFNPHLTLGRVRWLNSKESLAGLMEDYSDREFQEETIDELVLFESILKPGGPEYRPMKKVRFKHDGP